MMDVKEDMLVSINIIKLSRKLCLCKKKKIYRYWDHLLNTVRLSSRQFYTSSMS